MIETGSISTVARVAFAVHLVAAVIFGLALLAFPVTFGGWFGYPVAPEVVPPLRAFGAMLLGFGGLSSGFGLTARRWEQIDYIVRCEIAYLSFQTVVFAVSAIMRTGPVGSNWAFAGISLILLALFGVSFAKLHG